MRTTIDLDPLVLAALKERQKREGKTLGVLVSELLSKALAEETSAPATDFHWPVKSMGTPLVDLEDKEALWDVLDRRD
jgi:hypothetical protein